MPDSEIVEPFISKDDLDGTLEDQFQLAKLCREIEAERDIEQLRKGALLLAKLCVMRQGMIRSLVRKCLENDKKEIYAKYEFNPKKA
jgi:hypothetical protein